MVATHYLYDLEGRLTDVWQPKVRDALSNTNQWPHWHYTYDGLGNLTRITESRGHFTEFSHDDQGRRTGRTLPAVNNTTVSEETTYDTFGREETQRDFKRQTTRYVYDDSPGAGGRLAGEYRYNVNISPQVGTAADSTGYAEKTLYAYDELGRQKTVSEYTGTTLTRSMTYAYDPVTGAVARIDFCRCISFTHPAHPNALTGLGNLGNSNGLIPLIWAIAQPVLSRGLRLRETARFR